MPRRQNLRGMTALTFIPAQTERAHAPWYDARCDTGRILVMASHHAVGRRFADMNACALADSDANVHWPVNAVHNGYSWIFTGHYDEHGLEIRRPMTPEERNRQVLKWTEAGFLTWRTGLHGGKLPATVAMRQAEAKTLGVTICWELKSKAYTAGWRARRFVATVTASGHDAYYMTLVTMAGWARKLRAFSKAGGLTALLAHGVHKTRGIKVALRLNRRYINRIWGSFA